MTNDLAHVVKLPLTAKTGKSHPVVLKVSDQDVPNMETYVELNLVQRLDAISNQTASTLDTYSDEMMLHTTTKLTKAPNQLYTHQEKSLSL